MKTLLILKSFKSGKLLFIVAFLLPLFSTAQKNDSPYDSMMPMVQCDKPVVLEGQPYIAKIFLGYYNSKANPEIQVDGYSLKVVDGVAEYKRMAFGEGTKSFEGDIVSHQADGTLKKYSFKETYDVVVGTAKISADLMNVLYVGMDNPVSVSVPGYPPDKVVITYTGMASWTGSKGSYIARPVDNIDTKEAVVTVSVKTMDGTVRPMGSKKFRIKRIPKPKILIGTLSGGPVNYIQLGVQKEVLANFDNFSFDGLKYTVTKYKVSIAHKSPSIPTFYKEVNGSAIPDDVKEKFNSLRTGDLIIFYDVSANGSSGTVKLDNAAVFTME